MNTKRRITAGWIPIEKELPDVDEDGYSDYILLSFSNYSLPAIGMYHKDNEGGVVPYRRR